MPSSLPLSILSTATATSMTHLVAMYVSFLMSSTAFLPPARAAAHRSRTSGTYASRTCCALVAATYSQYATPRRGLPRATNRLLRARTDPSGWSVGGGGIEGSMKPRCGGTGSSEAARPAVLLVPETGRDGGGVARPVRREVYRLEGRPSAGCVVGRRRSHVLAGSRRRGDRGGPEGGRQGLTGVERRARGVGG